MIMRKVIATCLTTVAFCFCIARATTLDCIISDKSGVIDTKSFDLKQKKSYELSVYPTPIESSKPLGVKININGQFTWKGLLYPQQKKLLLPNGKEVIIIVITHVDSQTPTGEYFSGFDYNDYCNRLKEQRCDFANSNDLLYVEAYEYHDHHYEIRFSIVKTMCEYDGKNRS